MPKNYSVPEGLKIFLNSVKSEITHQRNRNSVKCYLPQDELQSLKELEQLQRDRKIVVKAGDKGAGIVIVNFEDYIKVCYEHLTSKQTNDQQYYSEVTDLNLEQAKQDINNVLKEGLDKEYIKNQNMMLLIQRIRKLDVFTVISRYIRNMTTYLPLDQSLVDQEA